MEMDEENSRNSVDATIVVKEEQNGNPSTSNRSKPNKTAARIGTLKVAPDGKAFLEIGKMSFDVHEAPPPECLQQFAAMDATHQRAMFLGNLRKRFIVAPNIDSLLHSV